MVRHILFLFLILITVNTSQAIVGPACGTPQFHNISVAQSALPLLHLPAAKSVADSLGDNTTFWALDNGVWIQTTATLRAVRDNVYVYVQYEDPGGYDVLNDGAFWNGYITQADVDQIADEFNNSIYGTTRAVFGAERALGVDNDAHTTILLMDIDSSYYNNNWLYGWILGYFYPGNERTTAQDPYSNQRKMIYIDTYPSIERGGETNYTPSTNHGDSVYPEGVNESYGTIAHEFQHMIHWYHDADEDIWINEGLADYAQFVNGYGHMMNHVNAFLSDTDDDLTQWGGNGVDYGGSYLFTLYLIEKYGGNLTAAYLVNDTNNGIAGVNTTLAARGYNQSFVDVFNDWIIANFVDDTTIYSGRYGYDNIDLRVQPSKVHSMIHTPFPVENVSANVSNWAADYIKFMITTKNNTLNLSFTADNHSFAAYVIATNLSNSSQTIVYNLTLDANNSATQAYYNFGQGYDTLVLIPSAQDSDYISTPSYSYNSIGSNLSGITIVDFGSFGVLNGQFNNPEGIALDPTLEYIYVADTGNHRIQIFTIDGTHVHTFGEFGGTLVSDCGCLFNRWWMYDSPQGITVDSNRQVYITDTQNDRVKVYSPYDGFSYIAINNMIGEFGAQDGKFTLPADVAVNSEGDFIVSESSTSSRVQIFFPNGTFKSKFGSWGEQDNEFDDPRAVDVDRFDNIYIADMDNNRIQVLSPNGTFDYTIGEVGTGPGQLSNPQGIALDTFGRVYVADTNNNRIQVFNPNGSVYDSYAGADNNTRNFSRPKGIAVDPIGRIYVADTLNNRIQIFGFNIPSIAEIYTLKADINLSSSNIRELDVVDVNVTVRNVGFEDASNFTVRVWVGNNSSTSLLVESFISVSSESTNVITTKWTAVLGIDRITVQVDVNDTVTEINEYNNEVNLSINVDPVVNNYTLSGFAGPEGVSVDSSLYFYIVDKENSTIRVYYPNNGTLYSTIGNQSLLDRPSDVAVDANGRVFIADTINNEIDVVAGSYTNGAISSLNRPQGIAVDAFGKVYVANTNDHNVKVYYSNWLPYLTIGGYGTAEGQFNTPMDVAVSLDGLIYVSDRFNHRVQIFWGNGSFKSTLGGKGSAPGLLDNPHQIAVDVNGLVYVADRDNTRVQIFNADDSFNFTFDDNQSLISPEGVGVGRDGRLYVTDKGDNLTKVYDVYPIIADNSPPVLSDSQPDNNTVLAPYTTSILLNITSDDIALCRISNTSDVSFPDMTNDFDSTNSYSHSENITGLTNNQTLMNYIRCQNTWGYNNSVDYVLRFVVSGTEVVLNEIAPNQASGPQWIELYNKGPTSVNISNWMLNHSGGSANYTISDTLPVDGFLVFYSNVTGVVLNSSEDSVFLYDRSGTPIDNISYTSLPIDYSYGRVSDGNASFTTFNTSYATPGTSNSRTVSLQQILAIGWNLIGLPIIF